MDLEVRFATRLSVSVDKRLRMLAILEGRPLGHVLDDVLDKALPSAEELAGRLGAEAGRPEVAAD